MSMPRKPLFQGHLRRQLLSFASMVGGTFMVFFVVFVMNAKKDPPKDESITKSVNFEVEKKPPKKPKKKKRKTRKPRKSTAQAPRAPNVSSAISGAAFELPGFNAGALGAGASELIGSFSKKSPMAEGAMDKLPKVRGRGKLACPPDAQKRGLEGYVLVNIFVREDGSVGRVKVLDARPKGVFNSAAKQAVKNWVFDPGVYDNAPVAGWVKQKVVFRLQKS